MWLGRIEGKVWATVKDESLRGVRLMVMQPVNELEEEVGRAFIAVDTIGVREGDLVYWVNSTEASFVYPDRNLPSEVSIVGLVDRLDVSDRELLAE